MKYTYNLPVKTKNTLEDIKRKLKRENIRVFEQHIVEYLIMHADIDVLRAHFGELTRRWEREKNARAKNIAPRTTRAPRKRKRS